MLVVLVGDWQAVVTLCPPFVRTCTPVIAIGLVPRKRFISAKPFKNTVETSSAVRELKLLFPLEALGIQVNSSFTPRNLGDDTHPYIYQRK